MNEPPDWLPPLVLLEDHEADKYLDAVHEVFRQHFLLSRPMFRGKPVWFRRDPIVDGKEAGFWHCVSEGSDENKRIPDPRRCERVRWIKALLEHSEDRSVDVWKVRRKGDERIHLWLSESYLVVLGKRKKGYQLITAFCTDRPHTVRLKRRERDSRKKN